MVEEKEEVVVVEEKEKEVLVVAEDEEVVADADWVQEGLKERIQLSPFHECGWLQCGPFQV